MVLSKMKRKREESPQSTVHSPQQDWQRLAIVKNTAVEMKKRKFIFLIECNKNTKVELEVTSFLECGDSSPLWDWIPSID
jgi:hypothetical protein